MKDPKVSKTITLLMLFLTIQISYAQVKEYGKLSFNKAVNISGKQRMLTQRMGKIYLYLLSNPNDFKAKKDLKITKIIFEKQNSILEANTSSEITKDRIKKIKETWSKYKEFLESTPNNKDAIKIVNTNSTILKQANSVVNAILLEAKGASNSDDSILEEDIELKNIINKSGKQRMLSQRLGLYYFANKPDLKTSNISTKLETVFSEIDAVLNDLLISSFNNDKIDEAIGEVMSSWEDLKNNKIRLFKQGYKDAEIYELSNSLTKNFNKITTLYEKIKIK